MTAVAVASRTCVGGRERNEDCLGTVTSGTRTCYVVSDGAGGHGGGAVASRLVVDHVLQGFQARPVSDPADLAELILDANDAVVRGQRSGDASLAHMHATVVVLVLDNETGRAVWGHVGDSRLYLIRDGRAHPLTRDDSLVQVLVDLGHLDAAAARTHPNKNQLVAALGMKDEITPRTAESTIGVQEGDVLFLCSDGWWDAVSEVEIASFIDRADSPEQWLEVMAEHIERTSPPGHDNFSAVAIWAGDPNSTRQVRPPGAAAVPPALL